MSLLHDHNDVHKLCLLEFKIISKMFSFNLWEFLPNNNGNKSWTLQKIFCDYFIPFEIWAKYSITGLARMVLKQKWFSIAISRCSEILKSRPQIRVDN